MIPKEYIANHINKLSLSYRYTVARILVFKTYELIQSNNGCYILFDEIDEETISQIRNFLETKLSSWLELFIFHFLYNVYIYNTNDTTRAWKAI